MQVTLCLDVGGTEIKGAALGEEEPCWENSPTFRPTPKKAPLFCWITLRRFYGSSPRKADPFPLWGWLFRALSTMRRESV